MTGVDCTMVMVIVVMSTKQPGLGTCELFSSVMQEKMYKMKASNFDKFGQRKCHWEELDLSLIDAVSLYVEWTFRQRRRSRGLGSRPPENV